MKWHDIKYFELSCYSALKNVKEQRDSGKIILPEFRDIFRAFILTPYDKVRVVILGQDPYPGVGPPIQANGLAFSVNLGVPLPRSLRNIFEEMTNDIGCPYPAHGSLKKWARQGVLLLNTSLTVEAGKINSHKDIGWNYLIKIVIEALNKKEEKVVWVLWGRHAQDYEPWITSSKIIKSTHPSPFSADRGFFGSKPFSKVNGFLKEPIDWSL